MSFCRECGKEAQEDWSSCPYCSQPIVPQSQRGGIHDSVVMGDVYLPTLDRFIVPINARAGGWK